MGVSRQSAQMAVTVAGLQVFGQGVRVHSIRHGLGGDGINSARFEIEGWSFVQGLFPSTNAMKSQNTDLETMFAGNDLVEIFLTGRIFQVPSRVFYGRIVGGSLSIAGDGEKVEFEARLDDAMLGGVVGSHRAMNLISKGLKILDEASFVGIDTDADLVFNPELAGRVVPNKSTFADAQPGKWVDDKLIIDPLSVRGYTLTQAIENRSSEKQVITNAAAASTLIDYWSIAEIVRYLLVLLADVTNVTIPTLATLQTVLPEDGTQIRNLSVKRGSSLAAALDQVLRPYGYFWYIEPISNPLPTFEFGKRGAPSQQITISRQPPGQQADDIQSEMVSTRMRYDIGKKYVDSSDVFGAPHIREGTFELIPAWDVSEPISMSEMLQNQGDRPGVSQLSAPLMFRKWVLNESGQYTGWFNAPDGYDYYAQNDWSATALDTKYTAFDLDTFWEPVVGAGVKVPRKFSRFYPTVTMNKLGTAPAGQDPGGVFLEYGVYNSDDAKWYWAPVRAQGNRYSDDGVRYDANSQVTGPGLNQSYRLLDGECGIVFDSPVMYLAAKAKSSQSGHQHWPRLRITASLVCGLRLKDSTASAFPLTQDRYYQAVDMTQFKTKTVDTNPSSDYYSVLWYGVDGVGPYTGNQAYRDGRVDDTTPIGDYNQSVILDNYGSASVTGDITLNAIDFVDNAYLGKSVTAINGLALGLQSNSQNATTPTYPIVTEMEYDIQNQVTRLVLGAM